MWSAQKADDYATLIERGEALLKFPLTAEERDYVYDLLRRVGGGREPILVDWFRSREMLAKYAPPDG